MRDEANLNQLLVLTNMENYNAILIEQGKAMSERLVLLREFVIKQMKTLAMVSMDKLNRGMEMMTIWHREQLLSAMVNLSELKLFIRLSMTGR